MTNYAQSINEEWKKQCDELKRENDELLAQLARCVYAINKTIYENGHLADGDDCTLIDLVQCQSSLSKQAKLDAKVLSVANAWVEAKTIDKQQDDFSDYLEELESAVRAAKEG